MHDLTPINCDNKTIETITTNIQHQLQTIENKDAIVRITLDHIPTQLYRALDIPYLRQLGKEALHFEIKPNIPQTTNTTSSLHYQISSLTQEFTHYLNIQDLPDKKSLLKLGLNYLNKIEKLSEST